MTRITQNAKGVTLVLVLAILTILTLLGVSFTFVMNTEMQAADNFANKVQADYLAELGLIAAENRLMAERADSKGHLTPYSGFTSKSLGVTVENGIVTPDVTVQDEESKLNLSVALDTENKDDWHHLSAERFFYARLTTAGFTFTRVSTTINQLYAARQKKQLKDMDDLKKIVGNPIYNAIASSVTFYSFESNVGQDNKQRVNVNTASAKEIYDRLKNAIGKEWAARLAVNIVDFVDSDDIPTLLTVDGVTYIGTENTPYLNEVMPWSKTPDITGNDGQYVELFNPYHDDIHVDGWRVEGAFGSIDLYGTVPSKGYFIITDKYSDDSTEGESDGYSYQINYGNVASDNLVENPSLDLSKSGDTLKLYNANGNLVDVLTYGSSAKDVSWEKDDPRVNDLNQKEHGTPYYKNNAYYPPDGKNDEDNMAYVADAAAKSIADLAFVSIASPETPWMTLRIDENSTTGISLDSVIDYLSIVDDKERVGAVNINTASYEVLSALPGLNMTLAKAIVTYRKIHGPFTQTSQLLKVPGMETPLNTGKNSTDMSTQLEQKILNFRKLSNWVTVRSFNFTIDSYARLFQRKKFLAESRIHAIVNRSNPTIVTVMERRLIP
jgi:competence ComEA-like helix-hairpin-helix protein